MRVAVIQLCSKDLPSENTNRAIKLAGVAATNEAEWIIFPENLLYMGDAPESIADTLEGGLLKPFREFAKDNHLWITIGSFPELARGSTKIYNTQVVIDPFGSIHSSYRKLHLFDVRLQSGQLFSESDKFSAGNEVITSEIRTSSGSWRIGMTTCYDLRFPELYRFLASSGAEVITVPSAFTFETGSAHWHTLLRARAIENQVYIIAPNQTGRHGGNRHSFGNSVVIDPWGNQLAGASEGEAIAYADLYKSYLHQVRTSIPVLSSSRFETSLKESNQNGDKREISPSGGRLIDKGR